MPTGSLAIDTPLMTTNTPGRARETGKTSDIATFTPDKSPSCISRRLTLRSRPWRRRAFHPGQHYFMFWCSFSWLRGCSFGGSALADHLGPPGQGISHLRSRSLDGISIFGWPCLLYCCFLAVESVGPVAVRHGLLTDMSFGRRSIRCCGTYGRALSHWGQWPPLWRLSSWRCGSGGGKARIRRHA